ncbi:MAG TPA: WYL domain-containing protein [Planctomycetaceae bacterium]|nr:WYL domain-containing protein [Blastopirellula sp.]HAY79638.1 WYL domain-containing protein [Planctomycetaceae bacterium]
MARNEQLIRQHKILQILERYKFGRLIEEIRDELVDELGLTSLHTRTVKRDLEALQAAGIHVEANEIARGRVWKMGAGAKGAHKITASATEMIALSLGRDLMYPLLGTPFWQGIESFWNKVEDQLPDAIWDHYYKYRQVLYVLGTPAKSYEKQHGMLKTINRAILEHRLVEIDYQKPGEPMSKRTIEPYAIVVYQSSLYIIAAAHEIDVDGDRIRHFKLDRFRKATARDEWFKPVDESDLQEYVGRSVGIFSGGKTKNFKVRISAKAAPWVIEDPWHAEQKVDQLKDGSIQLTVKAAHELEIIPRVLALGKEAELLSPKSCRTAIGAIYRQMADVYDDA